MIVSDKNVQDALVYLSDDPHPIAVALKGKTDAENARKEAYAKAFLAADGSVDARKAEAEIDADHIAAKAEEAESILELERHRARTRAADMILEIWRTENANARAAERIR